MANVMANVLNFADVARDDVLAVVVAVACVLMTRSPERY